MRLFARLAVMLCAATAASTSVACTYLPMPVSRITDLQRSGRLQGVILVRVREARYTRQVLPDARPWTAEAEVARLLRGSQRAGRVQFGRNGDSAACDDGTPAPAPGDLWVLYLTDAPGRMTVSLSYPLAVARRADPSLPLPLP